MLTMLQTWAASMRFIDWFSLVSGLCSIIALPIALWQIHSVKAKVQATEEGIGKILALRERERLELVQATIIAQHDLLNDVIILIGKAGSSKAKTDEKISKIVKELNHCINDMPSKEENTVNAIRGAVVEIQKYQSGKEDSLRDAEAYLYSGLQQIKISIESYQKDEVKMVSQ